MEITKDVARFIEEIRAANGSNAKTVVLKKYKDNQDVADVLKTTYNGMVTYGCNSKSCAKHDTVGNTLMGMESLFEQLANRELSGHAALEAANRFATNCAEREIFWNILDRDLKIGVGTTIINKVFLKLIPKFNVALADRYDKMSGKNVPNFEKDTWIQQAKSDGTRCVLIVENGKASAWARSGKEIFTLSNLITAVEKYSADNNEPNFVLDGEACIFKSDGVNDFQSLIKQIKKKNHTVENVTFTIFDKVSLEGFLSNYEETTYDVRLQNAKDLVNKIDNKLFEIIRQEGIVTSDEDLMKRLDEVDKRGEEGLIIRKANSAYEGKRTKTLLKLKKFADAEYIIEDQEYDMIQYSEYHVDGKVYISKENMTKEQIKSCTKVNQEEMMLKRVSISHKGNKVGVGSGFSHEIRIASALANGYTFPNVFEDVTAIDLMGKEITVCYFEETQNESGNYSLRFPTCKTIYLNGRDN